MLSQNWCLRFKATNCKCKQWNHWPTFCSLFVPLTNNANAKLIVVCSIKNLYYLIMMWTTRHSILSVGCWNQCYNTMTHILIFILLLLHKTVWSFIKVKMCPNQQPLSTCRGYYILLIFMMGVQMQYDNDRQDNKAKVWAKGSWTTVILVHLVYDHLISFVSIVLGGPCHCICTMHNAPWTWQSKSNHPPQNTNIIQTQTSNPTYYNNTKQIRLQR